MSSEEDFKRIQEVTEKASAKLLALRNNLNSKLESFSTSEKQILREKINLPLSPQVPLPPATRLASIAASLSPSSYSTPNSNRAAAVSTVHYPINTPPTGNGSRTPGTVKSYPSRPTPTEDPLCSIIQSGLAATLADFQKSASSILAEIQSANSDRDKCLEEFLIEITNRESNAMEQIVETVRMIGNDDGSDTREELIDEGFKLVQREVSHQKNETEKIRKLMVSDKLRQVFGELFSRVETELAGWRSRMSQLTIDTEQLKDEVMKKIESQIEREVRNVREECLAQIDGIRDLYERTDKNVSLLGNSVYPTARTEHANVTGKLVAENAELKAIVRKMKLGLSKWRIDYLNHAKRESKQSQPKRKEVEAISTNVSTPAIVPSHFPVVSPGDQFPILSESLMKMWSAVPPSSEELVQFLVNMEAAVNSGGKIPLASVYDYECRKNVEKLPLAQLAAQRELMLSSEQYAPSDMQQIDDELLRLIVSYERTYKQRFVFSNAEEDGYACSIERQQFQRTSREP